MPTIEAKVICDSIGKHSPRLSTFVVRYPKFVHAEHMRHRTGSYCVSSSRAVPVSKNLEEVRSDALRAGPVYWASEQKGMQGGEELDDEFDCVDGTVMRDRPVEPEGKFGSTQPYPGRTQKALAGITWRYAALGMADSAEQLMKLGVHKSIVNRLLEPFLHVNVLVTSCEPGLLNFFGLRLDKAAQPEIRALAEAMWAAWCESTPQRLEPGQWHLPFVDDDDVEPLSEIWGTPELPSYDSAAIRVSVARCARLSYTSFETGKRSTIEEDLKLYDRLITSHPIHASPAEHIATPDKLVPYEMDIWQQPELHGNLPSWVQYRKTLPGEAVAELPEGYTYGTNT